MTTICPPPRLAAAQRAASFVPGPLVQDAQVVIEGAQAHYLVRVMRMNVGDAVILCDDASGEWAARATHVGKRDLAVTCEILLRPREDVPDFTLCAALLKKDRFDLVLEKACELGVARIQPVLTRRCVADKLNMDRARALLTEAAEQCARTALPVLAEPMKLDAMLKGWEAGRAAPVLRR
jgi:16S rRNA (uracil1498-N3)-methyltransferase